MTNNNGKNIMLNSTSVVYQLICPNEDWLLLTINYIGTTSTLSRRLTTHLTNGAIREHQIWTHHSNLTREHIVNITSILRQQNDINRLLINEAIIIKLEKPEINRQDTGAQTQMSSNFGTLALIREHFCLLREFGRLD